MSDVAPRAGTAAWWLARTRAPAGARRRRMLSLDRITGTALALLDTEGPDRLTMRRVAQELGCSQGSLYRHVASREELITLTADHAIRNGLEEPPEGLSWRQRAEWSARAFRGYLLAHPAATLLLRGTERLGPHSLRGVEHTLAQFTREGLDIRQASAAASAVATFVVGSVQFNLGGNSADPDEQRARATLYASLDLAAHPLCWSSTRTSWRASPAEKSSSSGSPRSWTGSPRKSTAERRATANPRLARRRG